MKKVAVVALSSHSDFADLFAKVLEDLAKAKVQKQHLEATTETKITMLSSSTQLLRQALTQNQFKLAKDLQDADVRIMAALDQSASNLLDELKLAVKESDFAGKLPVFCDMSNAIAEYCCERRIARLWVHCSGADSLHVAITRSLSKSGIMLVGTTARVDSEMEHLVADLAVALQLHNEAARKVAEQKQMQLQEMLEYYVPRTGAQGVLLGHWAWPMFDASPNIGKPYLLSSTAIYAEKLVDVALSYR